MQLSQRIRIFPTPEQEDVLWHLSERCRLAYNFALSERKTAWEKDSRSVGYMKQQNDLPMLKQKYPEYGWVHSKVLQMTLRILDADYKSFYALRKKGDEEAQPPKYKGKNYFTTMVHNQSGFKVENNVVWLSQSYNKGITLNFAIPDKFKFKKVTQVTISQDDRDEYYLSIVHEVPTKPYDSNDMYQAIDLGVSKTVTAVNMLGKFFEAKNPRPDKYWNPKADAIQSKRDHCRKYSRGWNKYNLAMNVCTKKRSNQIKDYQHKLSRKMVNNTRAKTIIIGDLNVKSMAQSPNTYARLNRSTQNNGYLSQFAGFLTYKSELVGKKVIEISEYNTSKMCCSCGKIHDMALSKRRMRCDCGNDIDRDRNSAVNIMVRFLSQNAKWTGYQQFADNLRQTGLTIVSNSQEAMTSNHPQVV
ncbi:MAG: Transposase [Candidatus Gottesmanbacteria bacterium GW2011_GWB1_49_7]|uniref:Transposase n=1 Tax=Candidatus Gottesmanbacteria bacterium GW2011_GWB1_49_7 TaxID=1618448 RepID=A0A0G1W1F3_9BACT|nr:MAG: Transposase [Candidatus Gottesmanbacteria bacterium GW2011_GWB1_49_7]